MDIYIGTERLDIPGQSISIHYGRIRFGGDIADDYSTDIDIPKTSTNLRLLGAFLIPEGNLIGIKIPASISVGRISEDGYVMVTGVKHNTITISVFVARIPADFLDKKISDVISDDSTTLIQWDDLTPISAVSASVGYWKYYRGVELSSSILPSFCKPSIKLSKLLNMISAATNIDIDTSSIGNAVLTATRMVESPACTRQVLSKKSMSEQTRRGSSYYSVPEDENTYGVKFTCDADLSVNLYVQNPTMTSGSVDYKVVAVDRSGNITTVINENLDVQHGVRHYTGSCHIHSGDIMRLLITQNGSAGDDIETELVIDYSNITSADVEEHDLTFYRSQTIGNITCRHQMFGVISNLEDITIRSLISSIAWHLGKVVHITPNSVTFADSTDKEINGTIVSMDTASDVIAKTIKIVDAADNVIAEYNVVGDYLEDSKQMQKSSFFYAPRRSKQMYEASIPEFSLKDDGSLDENDIKGIPISIPQQTTSALPPSGKYLRPLASSQALLVKPSRALGVTIETFDDVDLCDFVSIDQHRFAVVEVDKDANKGISTINAIQV